MLGLGPNETSASPLQKGMGILSAVYHIPVAFVRGRGAFTNTAPTAPYRSAGRPEVIFVIERLIDLAADRLALDPVALRQRNLIPSAAQPYTNPAPGQKTKFTLNRFRPWSAEPFATVELFT
jgi:aerobic carbon-monoxide dehydrogenase large subunit